MKSVYVLFAGNSMTHAFEKVFDSASAFQKACEFAAGYCDDKILYILVSPDTKKTVENNLPANIKTQLVCEELWTNAKAADAVAKIIKECKADFALYSWADCPFVNKELTEEIIKTHLEYKAEYTFADGYPYGLAPEAVDGGACSIISAIAENAAKNQGEKQITRSAFFDIMSADINSFEIETVLADKDYRMLRYEFEASEKAGLISCRNFYEGAKAAGFQIGKDNSYDLIKVCDEAEKNISILKTIPHFYNVQITSSVNTDSIYSPAKKFESLKKQGAMDLNQFKAFVKEAAIFSEKATVSLSAFGEPLLHPQFLDFVKEVLLYPGFSVLVETDGLKVTEELAEKLAEIPGIKDRINFIVLIDGVDESMYQKINGIDGSCISTALNGVCILEKYFEHHVYPQMIRSTVNESQLEAFFRFWKEKESPSKGEYIIQKYDSYCHVLPELKSADLSPVSRNPCWHLRRDFTVLWDGSVPVCKSRPDSVIGNVFEEGIEKIWKNFDTVLKQHLNKDYDKDCRECDESYTFNF